MLDVENRVEGTVVRGHRVASGASDSSPYADGTIAMQSPIFRRLGIDLSPFYPATINVDISPLRYSILESAKRLDRVRWCDEHPPETFSFSDCTVVYLGVEYTAMIYYPHPETKVTHFQADTVLEILAPFIPGLDYGSLIAVVAGDDIVFTSTGNG